ncbi:MAG: hypothetical protein AAGB93_14850 [Planctomycetota bacterium]
MPEDRPDGAPAPAERRSLDPKSAGCIVPAVLVLAVLVAAWFGIQSLIGNTGKWSLAAADFGLDTSGLPEQAKEPFRDEIGRLRGAYEAGLLGPQDVVGGVGGLLETRTIQLLVVDDLVVRRLPASGLDPEERDRAAELLGDLAVCVDGGTVPLVTLLDVLGPLTEVPEDGGVVPLDDAGLRDLAARAEVALDDAARPETPRAVDAAALLSRFSAHVDETLAAARRQSDGD